jgi:hypothetical protein
MLGRAAADRLASCEFRADALPMPSAEDAATVPKDLRIFLRSIFIIPFSPSNSEIWSAVRYKYEE